MGDALSVPFIVSCLSQYYRDHKFWGVIKTRGRGRGRGLGRGLSFFLKNAVLGLRLGLGLTLTVSQY